MSESEFEALFRAKYNSFCNYANTIIQDESGSEDIVQEVFVDFWKRHSSTEISFKAENYLIRAVKFKCIDFIRKRGVHRKFVHEQSKIVNGTSDDADNSETDVSVVVNLAINELPPKTKEVFILGKINKLSYKEIALKLGISEKTVENQMSRAFKHLRIKLKDFKIYCVLAILNCL